MNYNELNQKEINKQFLRACKKNDLELVKYLLTSDELKFKAELNISKQTGYANPDKEGFVPFIMAVQYNAPDVTKYFIENLKWLETLKYEAKIEILSKSVFSKNIDLIKYVSKSILKITSINDYQKPYFLSHVFDSIVDTENREALDYFLSFDKKYKQDLNGKFDKLLPRAAQMSLPILNDLLSLDIYKTINSDLYWNCVEKAKYTNEKTQGQCSVLLLKKAQKQSMFDIELKYGHQTNLEKAKKQILHSIYTEPLEYFLENVSKERFLEVINADTRDYFYVEDNYINKNIKAENKIFKLLVDKDLFYKDFKEKILYEAVKYGYHNMINDCKNLEKFLKDVDLSESLKLAVVKTSQNNLEDKTIKSIIEMDHDKKLDITFDDYFLFSTLESIKFFNKNNDDFIKNIVLEYDIDVTEKLLSIYKEKNEDMFNFLNKKALNKKLNNNISENKKIIKSKI